jgi:hypothetical protein
VARISGIDAIIASDSPAANPFTLLTRHLPGVRRDMLR